MPQMQEDTTKINFYLYKISQNASELAQDLEFITFIEDICTLSFTANRGVTPQQTQLSKHYRF
jgi:hypothetical protein